jgi:hypothetical protein
MVQQLRLLSFMLMGSIIALGVALFFVLGPRDGALAGPALWANATVIAVSVGAFAMLHNIGYRAPAVSPTEPRSDHTAAFQTSYFLRFAFAEVPALVSFVLAFVVVQGGIALYLVGGVVSFALAALHVYPSERVIERYRAQLEREGGTSYLREDLGL